jgi:hypothetical protein
MSDKILSLSSAGHFLNPSGHVSISQLPEKPERLKSVHSLRFEEWTAHSLKLQFEMTHFVKAQELMMVI